MVVLEDKYIYNLKIHKKQVLVATFSVKLGREKHNYINCKIFNKIFIAELEKAQQELKPRFETLNCTLVGYLGTQNYKGLARTAIQVQSIIIKIKPIKLTRIEKEVNEVEQARLESLEANYE